jgi:hypothetical protein
MKYFIAVALFSLNVSAFEAGYYECKEGNNDSICPQKIAFKKDSNGRYAIRVVYSGDCGDQGPFTYGCESMQSCGNHQVSFDELSATSYMWRNLGYDFYCRFEKAQQP